jgi:hypothetical protein
MGRKALFGLSLRLSCGPLWDFSDSLSRHFGDGAARDRPLAHQAETFARSKVTLTEPCQERCARPCAKTHLWGPGFGTLILGRLLRNTLAPP